MLEEGTYDSSCLFAITPGVDLFGRDDEFVHIRHVIFGLQVEDPVVAGVRYSCVSSSSLAGNHEYVTLVEVPDDEKLRPR